MLIAAVKREKHITYIHSSAHIPSTHYIQHMYRHTTHTQNIQAYATHIYPKHTNITHTFCSIYIPHTCIHNTHTYIHYYMLPCTHRHTYTTETFHTHSTHIHIYPLYHTDILYTHILYMYTSYTHLTLCILHTTHTAHATCYLMYTVYVMYIYHTLLHTNIHIQTAHITIHIIHCSSIHYTQYTYTTHTLPHILPKYTYHINITHTTQVPTHALYTPHLHTKYHSTHITRNSYIYHTFHILLNIDHIYTT